jgi:hypothetical protein
MTAGGLAMSAVGASVGAMGTLASGKNAAAMGQYQQQEYGVQADEATATAQRQMMEQQRETRLVQSTLTARAAGSGASASAPSVISLGSQIAGRGEYNALMSLSQGENQAAGLTSMGRAAAYGGSIAEEGSRYAAVGTLAGGAGSMFRTLAYSGRGGAGMGFGLGTGAGNYLGNTYSTMPDSYSAPLP